MRRMAYLKFRPGFTLADMMVATAIIVTISVVMVINFRGGKQRDELRSGGLLLASLVHEAQAYTLAGRTVDDFGNVVVSRGGYGVSFDTQNDLVTLFADGNEDRLYSPGGELWESQYALADYNVQLDNSNVCVDFGSGCESNYLTIDYVFIPPSGSRSLLGFTLNQGSFQVVLRHSGLPGKGMRLTCNAASGQVSLGPIEDIP